MCGDYFLGKIFVIVTLISNLVFIGLAIQRSFPPHTIEMCIGIHDAEVIIELVLVIELLIFALARFLACSNMLLFWLQPHTIVDVLTLSHIFIALYFGVDWVGVRFLRFIWLTQVSVVLQFTPLVRSQNIVDLFNLFIYFLILWLTSSGILHLIEAQGDYWRDDADPHTVLIYVYLTMVTMSTVGYGDFSPVTDLGRGFMILFILAGLAFFAAILPTLVDVVIDLYAKYQYAKFDTTHVPKHVIVCGHITATTATDFLKDFLHPDRGDTQTHVLFLHPERPDKDLKHVLRSHYRRVQFLLGSVLDRSDLYKAHLPSASAVIILANKYTNNSTVEDHANLFMVVSVKNTREDVRVIIQVLHSFSKIQVTNIEGWTPGLDNAVCLNELKLGLLAQSCLCPGFSTLIANLFYTSDFPMFSFLTEGDQWKEHYIKGASNEVYPSNFSEFFDGMTFHEAAEVCFNKLNLVMLALEQIQENCHMYYVNPSPSQYPDIVINHNFMLGYFIAQDNASLSAVNVYCEGNSLISPIARPLLRRTSSRQRSVKMLEKLYSKDSIVADNGHLVIQFAPNTLESSADIPLVKFQAEEEPSDKFLGEETDEQDDLEKWRIHVGDPIPMEKIVLSQDFMVPNRKPGSNIQGHIVVCLFADENSPLLGLHNFLKPLRSKQLPPESIKPVVIVCEKAFIEKEWPILCDIPEVYLVFGSPLLWSNLAAAKVSRCSMCVILSALESSSDQKHVGDKEAVLCNLRIRKQLKNLHRHIRVLTDLRHESSVQFLDFRRDGKPDERIYKSRSYACGELFSATMFDSVTSAAFHSPGAIYLVDDFVHSAGTKNTCQVISQPIHGTGLAGKTFGEFYNEQLKEHKICMGLSRKLTPDSNQSYVITSPDSNLPLQDTDIAFILS